MFIVHWMQPQIYFKRIACMLQILTSQIKERTTCQRIAWLWSLWGKMKPQAMHTCVFFRAIKMKSRRHQCYYFNFFTVIALALHLNAAATCILLNLKYQKRKEKENKNICDTYSGRVLWSLSTIYHFNTN